MRGQNYEGYYTLHYFHYGCDPGVSALDPGRGGVK